jgi:hypothetical protein
MASRLGIGVSVLAGWMRAAGVDKDGPLCESDPVREEALREIAWRAAKDCGLASGREPGFTRLGFGEREALRIFGYEVPEPAGRHLRAAS